MHEIYVKNNCKFWMHAFVRNGRKRPGAAAGASLALIKTGDIIRPDLPNKSLHLQVSDEELFNKRFAWQGAGTSC